MKPLKEYFYLSKENSSVCGNIVNNNSLKCDIFLKLQGCHVNFQSTLPMFCMCRLKPNVAMQLARIVNQLHTLTYPAQMLYDDKIVIKYFLRPKKAHSGFQSVLFPVGEEVQFN